MTPGNVIIYSTTRDVARLLVDEGMTVSEAQCELSLTNLHYHIKRLLEGGYILKSDPLAAHNYIYVRGPNYDLLKEGVEA